MYKNPLYNWESLWVRVMNRAVMIIDVTVEFYIEQNERCLQQIVDSAPVFISHRL